MRRLADEATVLKLLKHDDRRKLFEARWAEVKAKNLKALDEGTFEGPVVPIGLRPPEQKPAKSGEDKVEKVEKASFLFLGSGSEGGSSGSGDMPPPMPPLEAPPPPVEAQPPVEAPLLEAPPPEVAPSKADLVMQKIAEAPARLDVRDNQALEEEFIAVAHLDDLRVEDKLLFEKVKAFETGVCARCRWETGCLSCDAAKAWAYACRSTLWNTAHEAVRPKAKPKGRPKKTAA